VKSLSRFVHILDTSNTLLKTSRRARFSSFLAHFNIAMDATTNDKNRKYNNNKNNNYDNFI